MTKAKKEKVWTCKISTKQAGQIVNDAPILRVTGDEANNVQVGDHIICIASYPNGAAHEINDKTFIADEVIMEDSLMKVIRLVEVKGVEVELSECC